MRRGWRRRGDEEVRERGGEGAGALFKKLGLRKMPWMSACALLYRGNEDPKTDAWPGCSCRLFGSHSTAKTTGDEEVSPKLMSIDVPTMDGNN